MNIQKSALLMCLLLYLNSHGQCRIHGKKHRLNVQASKQCNNHAHTRPKHYKQRKQQYPFWEYYRMPHYYDYAIYDDVGFGYTVYI